MRHTEADFDIAGLVVRARRLGDLSQRDLASKVGLTQPSIAKIEGGQRQPSVSLFARIMVEAGLRLCVVDRQGREIDPVPDDAVRDNAGRRFPAHLDVAPPDRLPTERLHSPRYDREPAKGWYHLRETRDRLRACAAESGEEWQQDHPTVGQLLQRRRDRLEALRRQARERTAARAAETGSVDVRCECEAECWSTTACTPACSCQCEPAQGGRGLDQPSRR
jgi:HTH-type transcriptional regulator/antitoxin HipB